MAVNFKFRLTLMGVALSVALMGCTTVVQPTAGQSPTGAVVNAQPLQVTGQVTYRERIALPPNQILNITLSDISVADAPSRPIAEINRPLDGAQVPIPFSLAVPAGALQDGRRYAVRATIRDELTGRLNWTTDTVYPVFPLDGDQSVGEMTVLMTRADSGPASRPVN